MSAKNQRRRSLLLSAWRLLDNRTTRAIWFSTQFKFIKSRSKIELLLSWIHTDLWRSTYTNPAENVWKSLLLFFSSPGGGVEGRGETVLPYRYVRPKWAWSVSSRFAMKNEVIYFGHLVWKVGRENRMLETVSEWKFEEEHHTSTPPPPQQFSGVSTRGFQVEWLLIWKSFYTFFKKNALQKRPFLEFIIRSSSDGHERIFVHFQLETFQSFCIFVLNNTTGNPCSLL